MHDSRRGVFELTIFLLLVFLAGGLGSYFTAQSVSTWYQDIEKPGFTPPDWVFGPVWTTLFVLMAVAAWIVWRNRANSQVGWAMGFFAIQLALNTLWSFLFFGIRNPGYALFEIVILWGCILITVVLFWRNNRLSGLLLVPYLIWVSYAAVLNYLIWKINV